MPRFWKKRPWLCPSLAKISIQIIVLRVSRRKNSKMLSAKPFFLWFWRNVYQSALVLWNLRCPGCLPALSHYSFWKMLYLKCLTVFWIPFCLHNCSLIFTVTLCYVLQQTHLEFWHIQSTVYSGIRRYIQEYSALLMHIYVYWGIIKAYSAPRVTLAYSKPCHIWSLGIFITEGIFKTLWTFDQAHSEPCHRTVYSDIIQPYSGIFRTLCNAYICRNLAYWESWNIQNISIIASRHLFRTLSYLRKLGKPCVTLAYWQFWNNQNPDMFKTQRIFRTLSKI